MFRQQTPSLPRDARKRIGAAERQSYLVLLLEELQIGHLVAAQVVDDVVALQQLDDGARLLLQLLQLGEDLLLFVGILGGRLLEALELAVEVGDVVGHVGLFEEGVLGLCDLAGLGLVLDVARLLVNELPGVEFEQGKDHVAVEVRDELEHEVVLGDIAAAVGRCGGHGFVCCVLCVVCFVFGIGT